MTHDDVAVQRWLLLGLVLSTTAAATARLLAIFRVDGLTSLEIVLLAVFALLFSSLAISFWLACLGAHALWRRTGRAESQAPSKVISIADSGRTVLAVPVYNEDPQHVFARLQAMWESLQETGAQDRFDFFVLSDSSEPGCVAAERAGWQRLRQRGVRVFYRNRERNVGHKSGNIAEFCQEWGAHYDYMVVLDADSLMTGETLVKLVQMMDANPRVALIQSPPMLVGGQSLFARTQQFASWVYGAVYSTGLARLQGPDGNYWGHNAIMRVRAFMQNCGLPILPGEPPLGGEIMSHDFVEAALLRRAGWEVWMAPEVSGSYETSPPTLIDHLKRDRRWCQGNLQHVKVLFAQGLRLPNRLHMALGAMSYLSSPLWLLLMLLFTADAIRLQGAPPVTYVGRYPVLVWPISHTAAFISVALATLLLLYGPKILSLIVTLHDRRLVAWHGGRRRLILSVILESIFSTLLAPVFMLSHSWFVLNILSGRMTRWGAQLRGGNGLRLATAIRAFAPHTIVGILVGVCAWEWTPADFWWYLPLLVGLCCAILLAWLTGSPAQGAAARRAGLFLVPSELGGVPIVDRVEALVAEGGLADASPSKTVAPRSDMLQPA